MKLAKDGKITKVPKSTKQVEGIFKKAMLKARQQNWNKIVIIGEGKDGGHWFHSRMPEMYSLGMIEKAKNSIMNSD